MSMFGFGSSASCRITLDDTVQRPRATVRARGASDALELPIFTAGDGISGTVVVSVPSGKKLEHQGVRVELMGQIQLLHERSGPENFTSLVRDLASPGSLESSTSYSFDFSAAERPYESYYGLNVKLRYCVRVTVVRNYQSNLECEEEFAVQHLQSMSDAAQAIKMEVGIEDCLHIEFEYDKEKYHLTDRIDGRVYFLLVRIKIKYMEVAIIKRESAGVGPATVNESETLIKYEVMDGVPVKGEIIPLRLYLSSLALTPSFRHIHNKFSVKYYVNLVLVDEEDRRYFKQQEIVIWRQALDGAEVE